MEWKAFFLKKHVQKNSKSFGDFNEDSEKQPKIKNNLKTAAAWGLKHGKTQTDVQKL